jgi:hypothetical protein
MFCFFKAMLWIVGRGTWQGRHWKSENWDMDLWLPSKLGVRWINVKLGERFEDWGVEEWLWVLMR